MNLLRVYGSCRCPTFCTYLRTFAPNKQGVRESVHLAPFQVSSVVEQSAVNRCVLGSNPRLGASGHVTGGLGTAKGRTLLSRLLRILANWLSSHPVKVAISWFESKYPLHLNHVVSGLAFWSRKA